MSWADTLNILLNTGKGLRDRSMQSQQLSSQAIQGIYDRKAQAGKQSADMIYSGLSGLASGMAKGAEAGQQRAFQTSEREAEQAYNRPFDESQKNVAQRDIALREETSTPEYREKLAKVLADVERESANKNYIYEAHEFIVPAWKDKDGNPIKIWFDESKNPVDDSHNVMKVQMAISKAESDAADYRALMGKTTEKSDDYADMVREIMSLKDNPSRWALGFLTGEGTPNFEKFGNGSMAGWWNAVAKDKNAKTNLLGEIESILDQYPKARAAGYNAQTYLNRILGLYTDETSPKTPVDISLDQGVNINDWIANDKGMLGASLINALAIGLGMTTPLDVKTYQQKILPPGINRKSKEEEAIYNMATYAETLINKKKSLTMAMPGVPQDQVAIDDLKWIQSIPLASVLNNDYSKLDSTNKNALYTWMNQIQKIINKYKVYESR